ncbi:MAG: glycosyltransferase family 4 protein [Clostridia bacterium]|nr:glycosyltransferase family 4 protein [Clostridia bacterium]
MNILFDAGIMNGDFVGIAKSTFYLYDHCHRICGDFHAYGFNTRRRQEYPDAGITLIGRKSRRELLAFAEEKNIKIVHYPTNLMTWPILSPLKKVLTVHDLIPYEDRNYFPCRLRRHWYAYRTRFGLKQADLITTVSDYSRQAILDFSDGQFSSVPIYWSVTLPDIFPGDLRLGYRYYLYVGGYDRRKGIDVLVRAFLDMKRKRLTECKLVLAGRPRPLDFETDKLIQTGVEDGDIIQTGYVSDEELCSLYANAVCMVYLSVREGFGLPVIEAMKYECPVITTRRTSLPEIGGDAACYVERDNREELVKMLLRLERDSAFRDQCVQAGKENLRRFNWDESACKYLEALESLMEN